MRNDIRALVLNTGHALKQHHLKLATAESCTGGGLSYWLTSMPGSSDWFDCGLVTYSNTAKSTLLGIHPKTITQFGAVSEQIASEMALGVLQRSVADISIAITGIAGPTGGSAEKPVGTVWIAWATRQLPLITQKEVFSGDRQAIRLHAIAKALEQLLNIIQQFPLKNA